MKNISLLIAVILELASLMGCPTTTSPGVDPQPTEAATEAETVQETEPPTETPTEPIAPPQIYIPPTLISLPDELKGRPTNYYYSVMFGIRNDEGLFCPLSMGNVEKMIEDWGTEHRYISLYQNGRRVCEIAVNLKELRYGWNRLSQDEYELWYYMSNEETPTPFSHPTWDMTVVEWINGYRRENQKNPLYWSDDLYVIARYRAWIEGTKAANGVPISHQGKLTTGENINVEMDLRSSPHNKTMLRTDYQYVAHASYNTISVTVFVKASELESARQKAAQIRAQYGDIFDAKVK